MTGSLVVIPPTASQPASQVGSLVSVLLVGSLPGRNSACGEPPWSYFCLWGDPGFEVDFCLEPFVRRGSLWGLPLGFHT